MAKISRYAAKRQEIMDMLGAGATYKAITERLQSHGFSVNYHSLYCYCKRLENPRFTPAPHCRKCQDVLIAESAVKPEWHIYICMVKKKQIRNCCQTSPQWCPRRGEKNNEQGVTDIV